MLKAGPGILSFLFCAVILYCGSGVAAEVDMTQDNFQIDARSEKAGTTGKKWLGDYVSPLQESDPDFTLIMDRLIYGEILDSGSLTEKQAALVALAGLVASQGWDSLPPQIEAALRVGASGAEIREAFYQCAPYVGMPNVEKALMLAGEPFRKAGIALPLESAGTVTEATRLRDGLETQRKIFGAETIDQMRENAPAEQKPLLANYLSAWCFGDFYTRKVLDLKMRELITFSAIVALGGCDPQAKAHAQANINVGNSKENLVDALATLLPWIGFPRALNGLGAVNAAVK